MSRTKRTPRWVIVEEMALQRDMAERGRRLRAAMALRTRTTIDGSILAAPTSGAVVVSTTEG